MVYLLIRHLFCLPPTLAQNHCRSLSFQMCNGENLNIIGEKLKIVCDIRDKEQIRTDTVENLKKMTFIPRKYQEKLFL